MIKKGVITDYLPWLLIALAVLAVIMFGFLEMKSSGLSLIDQIKNLFGN
jgi:hypothetical protein